MLENILRKFWKGSDYLLGNNDWIENNDWGSHYLSGGSHYLLGNNDW